MRIRPRLDLFVILSLAVLSACTGGQGGDPGESSGGTGGTGGDDAGGTGGRDSGPDMTGDDSFCSGQRWDGPDAPRLSGECSETQPGSFRCECEEKSAPDGGASATREAVRDANAEHCKDALLEACAIDLVAPRSCTAEAIGSCFPTDASDTWRCQCDDSDELIETDAASCTAALTARCTQTCQSAFGGCGQALSAPDAYGCRCIAGSDDAPPSNEQDGGAANGSNPVNASSVPALGFASCADALANTCGERCSSAAGECAFDDDDALDCTCSAGEVLSVPLAELGGAGPDACWRGLLGACGEELSPALSSCDSSYDGHDASCEALPLVRRPDEPVSNVWEYRCACDDGAAATLQDITCYRALQASCPDAIPPSAVAAATGALGALCESASDCDLGACYVPGTQVDSICSAICETDDDCPSDALCSFIGGYGEGHCFGACESDVECGLRNDAQQNPLYCAERGAIDLTAGSAESGRICVQHSEP